MEELLEKIKTELAAPRIYVNIADIVVFAFLLYGLFVFLKKNNASRMIKFALLYLAFSVAITRPGGDAGFLELHLLSRVFSVATLLLILAVGMLFPQEVRRGLWRVSSPKEMRNTFITQYDCSDIELKDAIDNIVRAALNMAKKDVGALIVIAPEKVPSHILESGTRLDAVLSCSLLESIFNTKAPLHDGAVFIRGNRIMAAGCFLPLTQDLAVDKELGTRHRAGIGVTETNNVLTIIVSEETGVISVAHGGELTRYYDSPMLTDMLMQVYGLKVSGMTQRKHKKKKV